MSSIELDEELDVPECYAELFDDKGLRKKKKGITVNKKIEISVSNAKWNKKKTVIKNLQIANINVNLLTSDLMKILSTNCSFKQGEVTINGDFGGKVHELLIDEYGISEDCIQKIVTKNSESTLKEIKINISTKDGMIYIKDIEEEEFISFLEKNQRYFKTMNFQKNSNQANINISEKCNFLKKLYKNYHLEGRYQIFEDNEKILIENALDKSRISKKDVTFKIQLPNESPLFRNDIKLNTKNPDIIRYYLDNLEFIRTQCADDKKQKEKYNIEDIQLEFTKGETTFGKTKWYTTFPAKSDLFVRDESQNNSNRALNVDDTVIIKCEKGSYEKMKGKIKSINDCNINVQFKLDSSISPPDYYDKDEYVKDESSQKPRFKYNIMFEPNFTIYHRRAIALYCFVNFHIYSKIREFIIIKNPGNSNKASINFPDDFDGSFDFTNNNKSIDGDTSKLKFKPKGNQITAIKESLNNALTLIQGPPGSGKTATLAGIVIAMLQQQKKNETKKRILICCQSNTAVINIIRVLAPPINAFGKKITWVGANIYDFKNYDEFLNAKDEKKFLLFYQCLKGETDNGEKYCNIKIKKMNGDNISKEDLGFLLKYEKKVASKADVVCCTLESSMKECIKNLPFETVFIDEASQAVEVACLLPIVHNPKKMILIGDQNQLGPIITGDAKKLECKYKRSLFERLIARKFTPILLDYQYRMHPKISQLSSFLFYENKIKDETSEKLLMNYTDKKIKFPITYFDCDGTSEKIYESFQNQKEAEQIRQIVFHLHQIMKIECERIGVISFYSAQVQLLKQKLQFFDQYKLKIATVDSFQGSERDFIIISTVLTDEDKIKQSFILDKRRLNVAITRAKCGLIIVGNKTALCNSSKDLWSEVFQYIDRESSKSESILVEKPNNLKKIQFEKNNNKGYLDKLFKEKAVDKESGFNMNEIRSSITNGKFTILWPNNKENEKYLENYVQEKITKMNNGIKITIAYDAESVCIQFGQIFEDNFDPMNINSKKDIPSIGNKDGIIAFFYDKENHKKNNKLMEIVKPLFVHENVTILTFDFTYDLEKLHKFQINPKDNAIIDCQFIDYKKCDNSNLIINTNCKSLKHLLQNIQYQCEYSENLKIAIEKNNEKDYPFNENKFIMMVSEVPKISTVTKKFLHYSANDVIFNGILYADILYKKRLESVKELSQQKLKDFKDIKAKDISPKLLRNSIFIANGISCTLHQKFNDKTKEIELINLWNKITTTLKISSKENKIIKGTLRINDDNINELNKRKSEIEKLLLSPDILDLLCSIVDLSIPPNVTPKNFDIN